MKTLVFWRTALVVILLGLMMLAALFICAHWHLSSEFFGHAVTGCIGLGAIAAGKSTFEHLANGGGLAGAAKALFTKAKPEGVEQAQVAP